MAAVPEDELRQGLRAAFGAQDAELSVLARLESTGRAIPRVLLRDADADASPVLKPRGGHEGRYQVVGEVARGGVGVVLKGRDVDLGRDVAMKVLRDEHEQNGEIVQRFVEEAQIGGQLQHPGIVPVYEMGLNDKNRPYFTMKLVKGKTLAALLRARKSPTEDLRRFLSIFERVCDTMAYAHSRGVVHRDLKPANVIVGAYSEVQIVDWGFAKVLGRSEPEHVERTIIETVRTGSESIAGSVLGTPAYMSPEQALGQVASLDKSSDVFGLGAILCEILTGKPPYVGEKTQALLTQAAQCDFDGSRLEDCELGPLALRCLSAKQSDRPQDAGELAQAIQDHLAAAEERAQLAQVAAAEEQARAAEARHARKLALAIAGAVLLACGSGTGLWIHGAQREREEAERIAQTTRPIVEQANLLRGEAEWDAALTAAKRARDLGAETASLVAAIEDDRQDAELADQLREADLDYIASAVSLAALDRAYEAYAPGGLAALEEKLQSRPEELRVSVALALDAKAMDSQLDRVRPRPEWAPLLEAARRLDPEPARDRFRTALLSGDSTEIVATARAIPAEDTRALCLAAIMARNHGSNDEAIRMLREAQWAAPQSRRVTYELAYALQRSGDQAQLEESLTFFRALAALDLAHRATVDYWLGEVYFKLDQLDEALEYARRSSGRSARVGGWWLLAQIQLERGQPNEARVASSEAKRLALLPDRNDPRENDNDIAWAMIKDPSSPLFDKETGLILALRSVERSAVHFNLSTLAFANYRNGDFAGAIRQARLSLAQRPVGFSVPYNRYVLALAHARLGDRDEARNAYAAIHAAGGPGDDEDLGLFEAEAKALEIDHE